MDASLVVAILSFLGVVALGVLQYRVQRRMAAIEKDRRSEEVRKEQAADVTCRFRKEMNSRGKMAWRLELENIGASLASDVRFEMSAVGGGELPIFINHPDEALPLPMLDRAQLFSFPIQIMLSTGHFFDVELTWSDGIGSRVKTMRLSLV